STYLGGSGNDYGRGIALDIGGGVWVTGLTASTDFHTTPNAFQTSLRGAGAYASDAFLTRLTFNGENVSYSTYLGGSQDDEGVAVAPIAAGAYMAGHTSSRDLPVTRDAFQPDHGGGTHDAFIANIQPPFTTGMPSLIHLSYVGGSDNEYLRGVALTQFNSLHNLYLVGSTSSQDFFATNGVVQRFPGGTYYSDGFVARVNLSEGGQTVSGRVTNASGAVLADVEVRLTGSLNRVVRTREDGTYSIGGIPNGSSLTLTASRDGFVFEPSNVALENINAPQFVDFSGDAPLVIRGRITDAFGHGRSVPVELSGAAGAFVQSDEFGYYRFPSLPAGGTYTVAPVPDQGFAYDPPSRTVASLDGDQVFNFTQLLPPKISGRVTDTHGQPRFCYVQLRTAQGGVISQLPTDSDGRYSFFPLGRGESYTVSPVLPDTLNTFAPESRAFENLQTDQTADFTLLPPVIIQGRITNEFGYGVMATVTLSGTVNRTAQTDWNGYYSFYELPRGGDYTVTPSIPGTFWTFTPASRSVTNAQQELQTFDFAAVRPLHVSGHITDENGNGLSNVAVRVNGSVTATAYTDPSGWYGFHELQRGGSYTLTPEHELYNFTPATRNLDNATEDQFVNFSAALRRYRIGGRVADANGNGVANVTVELNGFQGGTTLTDAAGNYAFEGLRVAQSYNVRASRPGWSFAPEAYAVADLRADETANFSASRLAYAIRGRVLDAQDGNPLAGVSVALGGSQSATAETDAAGNYAFTNLPSEGNYTVTPTHRYYNVAPASRAFDNLLADQEAPFNATRVNYSVSGRVVDASGAGLSGVNVALSGHRSASVYTDANGGYTFADLPAGYGYTVTASAAHYSFAPPARTFESLDHSSTADFTATLLRHDILGRVTDANGVGVGGVDINLSGAQTASVRTDASGNYAFASLPAGGNYTLTAFHGWYAFTPVAHSFNDLGGNQTANFTGTLHNFRIQGQVTEGLFGVAGVTVSLSGSQTATVQTDAGGYYSFSVPAGGNYAVAPSHAHFVFSPTAATFNALSIHQSANFAAARLTYQLSGYARDACNRPVAATTMTLARSGASSSTAQTDAAGFYSFTGVPAGHSYTLTPSKTNYIFNPSSAALANLSGNLSNNFTGTPATVTTQIAPLADAYVRGGTSAGINYGTATTLVSRLASSASNTYESYLTFDVGQQCTVSNVKLRLYGRLSSGSNLAVSVYSVADTAWTETGIKWSNKPPAGSLLRTTTIVNSTAAFYEWDITNYVRGEINAGRTRI
ncbi:MAG TPA: carboxypeptidase regulatory-like domain-containing protein, partial [Pyrinomonadaceae bacterium]|nr:carboxypeptidase regulatory-like domain-containing protein [Pyrinomonadaceae bacterium]